MSVTVGPTNEAASPASQKSPEYPPATPEEQKTDDRKLREPPWYVIAAVVVMLFVLLMYYGLRSKSESLLAVELLLAAASLAVGGMLGFLFGIPRTSGSKVIVQEENDGTSGDAQGFTYGPGYEPSNNLEQVADWLTKIIVGVGLVELHKAGELLANFGALMGKTFTSPGVDVVSQLVVVVFVVIGFISGFLWTRIYYGAIQVSADIDVRALFDRVSRTEQTTKEVEKVTKQIAKGELKVATTSPSPAAVAAAFDDKPDPIKQLAPDIQAKIKRILDLPATDYNSDPNGDFFGDAPREQNGRRLEALITAKLSGALTIKIRVRRTGGEALRGPTILLLHPTFQNNRLEILYPKEDVIEETIISEGWFTVTAILDDGATVLSYPLRDMPDAPAWFRRR